MGGSITWLVRDAQNMLHRREVPTGRIDLALTALLEPTPDAQAARLIDHAVVRDHAPTSYGLIVIDLPQRRILNASRDADLDRIPFLPALGDHGGWRTVIESFDAAGLVHGVRFSARRRRWPDGSDPFAGILAHAQAGTTPDPAPFDPAAWSDLETLLTPRFHGASVVPDAAYGAWYPTAQVTWPVLPQGFGDVRPVLTSVSAWRHATHTNPLGLDPSIWDLFSPEVLISLAPFTMERLAPAPDEGDDRWLERVRDRLDAMNVESSPSDLDAWDGIIGRAVVM